MFADVVGYTAAMARSEAEGLLLRRRHRSIVRPLVERYGGQWIEETGDESLSSFASALDAVNCALAIRDALRDDRELQLRIGIHLGDVVFEDGRVYGDGVNIAARIRPLAEPGGICVSDEVRHSVQNQSHIGLRSLGEHSLKNVPRPIAVHAVSGEPAPPAVSLSSPREARRRAWPAVIGAGALVVTALVVWQFRETLLPAAAEHSLAVLPFADLSPARDQEPFADGLSEELIHVLSRVEGLRVTARTSAFAFKGRNEDVRRIGEQLGVGAVVEGSVRKDGDRLRITAQLVQTADGFHVWSESFDRGLEDVFAVQEEIARAVAQALKGRVLAAEDLPRLARPTENLRAY